ncbi:MULTISPECIES: energy transducer TonB [Acinetobacter]|uniref:Protein TonB n=1 Tax=Acinetobacter pittii TaxID=48296 RepID=A0A0R0RKH8_ACIPI|nr:MULTISPECIES: energy transducer TonB [Acinetobacter]EXS25092.1 tonB family C-terminal domain protein [Acinetobacter baumannii 573719]KRI51001.1 energy transducer TonB [Acinetobacter pittii]MBJ8470894.1 energy transducer TonB [Acinetobacter pittii]MBJ8500755.1 energy transducer TonB [Acinetobacter pittii]MBJ9893102.1 energy transducer TonB [Acinetobacter pittii]
MGMTFTDIENKSAKRLIGIAAVIFLHLLVAYILMSGLAKNIQKPAEKPVELQIIQDIKPPPPPKPEEPKPKEKPPEPPKMVEKVAKVPEPVKQVEKVTPVQKTTPVAQPTKVATPAPATPSTPSPSPVAAPAPVAAAPAPKPAGVSRGVSEGSAGCEKPEYPREALMNEEQGTVRIRVLVDTSGKVIDAKVKKSSGSKILDKAATKAYSLCTFKPAMKDGVPQQDWYEIEYPFVIE